MKSRCLLLSLFPLFSFPLFAQQPIPVHFNAGSEFLPANFTEIRKNAAVQTGELVNGYYYRYVQCAMVPAAADRAALEQDGVVFVAYVPSGTYLVAIPEHFRLENFEKIQARSVVPVRTAWKMAPGLREQPYGEWALHGDRLDVNLQVYPQLSIADAAALCRRKEIAVLLEGNQNGFLQVRLPKDSLEALAAQPWVRSLELVPPPAEPDDLRGRALHRSNLLDSDHALGKKFNGEGVSVLVRDDGPLGPHIDYQGRLNNQVTATGGDGPHGDGVGGILGGAGNLDPTVKGMAAGASIYSVRYTPDFQDQTLPLHLDKNVTITNTSYSNGCNVGYTLASQTVDRQLFEHPTLTHVFSAGNSNGIANCLSYGAGNQWGNITGGHKMAKNAIVAANLYADATIVESSSRGPAYDGRLKPDISANGNEQGSVESGNGYIIFGGTSAAAPGIAGCLAQLTQAYQSLYNGEQAPAALLKAALLNTANDLGNPGPDFKFGWGHVNAARAYHLLEESRWQSGQADQNEQKLHTIQVPANVRQVRVMLYWTDPPAGVAAAKALVNDLGLSVSAPDGMLRQPWKLDPTPDPDGLDQPAGRGRDSLNNTEQVAIDNPAPGAYQVRIAAPEVPFGPQPYVLVWEFLTDEIRLTYPAGGEGFVPGETERIHWDAFGNQGVFSLRYSTDNGFSWQQIIDVPGNQRMYDWQVPNTVSSRVRVMIQRGLLSHVTEFPLTIAPLPTDIEVEKVCPKSMTLRWKPANDTLASDVYLLGKKYMEVIGTTSANTFTIPLPNGGTEQWISVRASHPNGLAGRRAIAIQWPGELKNCVQPDDLGVREVESPSGAPEIRCQNFTLPVTVRLNNEGTNIISGAVLNYQANSLPVVSQNLPNIAAGQTTTFTFQVPIPITNNSVVQLKIWSTYTAEDAFFNDTLYRSFVAVAKPLNGYFTEDFEGPDFPPLGWRVGNPDQSFTWAQTVTKVTGADGLPTYAMTLNNFFYITPDEEDLVDMIPVDLAGVDKPGLSFSLAHAREGSNTEKLRVEVYPACDLNAQPVVVWEKSDPELTTAGASNTSFIPNKAADWRREIADLGQFAGQKILIRFVAVNGTGNNIYLDDIGISKYQLSQPQAAFSFSPATGCIGDTAVFKATPSGGDFTNYEWYFDAFSLPSSAKGLGPHPVRYLSAGVKNVRLIAWNPLGADTLYQSFVVTPNPSPNFSVQLDGQTASFFNSSQNAQSYLWDFGDGNTSTDVNPVHTYATAGVFAVTLSATTVCKTNVKALTISTITAVSDPDNRPGVHILPNPTAGDFRVEINSRTAGEAVRLILLDAQGRMVKSQDLVLKQGIQTVSFENLSLPKGMYQLTVQTDKAWQAFSVVVQ